MNIAFFDTKPYDKIWFDSLAKEYGYRIKYYDHKLTVDTALLAGGHDVVCVFVNDMVDAAVIEILHKHGVKLIALRCAGYNNVDLAAARDKLRVVRVPSYSPTAVAEHAMAQLLTLNRKTHRAYARTRDNNFSLNGLMGMDLRDKTMGIIGTGQIGKVLAQIATGFGMRVLANDPYPDEKSGLAYVTPEELFTLSDVISLHCPLTKETYHLIGEEAIGKMKDGVILLNTSRGALVDTEALLEGLISRKIGGAGLDVYEEEGDYFFEDKSSDILEDEELARLLSLPNVLVTSHQAFFTREAMQAIAMVTMENIYAAETGAELVNEVRGK
jgi:D-lactate dehydrogenase